MSRSLEDILVELRVEIERRFSDVVLDYFPIFSLSGALVKLRIILVDKSFLDVYWSRSGRFSLHWERRHVNGTVYRHDNAPHEKWRYVKSFPKHFHKGREDRVVDSNLPDDPLGAVLTFLKFIRNKIKQK